jgi:RNA polymerase sigma-70 factor (ECF subfamily)
MLRSMGLAAADIDDVDQELLRLVVLPGARGEAPKLASYRGQGSLARWCRVTATRLAMHARPTVTPPPGATLLDEGPMRGLERATYAQPLGAALAAAVARLGDRDRRLLQLSIVERVRNRALGTMFDVHESTVGRWLASAKAALRDEVRRCMHESTGVSAAEVDSIIRAYDGRFELSTRLLWPASGA